MSSFEDALMHFTEPNGYMREAEEPDIEGGVRHLSISSDGTIDSLVSEDENPTPPQSPRASTGDIHLSALWNDLRDDTRTPTKDHSHTLAVDNDVHNHGIDRAVFILPPPSPSVLRSTVLTPTLPSTLAARRAASGQLPNKALLSLQRMTFETPDAGTGLGVGPNSAGWAGMEGISPGQQAEAMAHSSISAWSAAVDMSASTNAFGFVMPATSPSTMGHQRRAPMPASPGVTFHSSPSGPHRSPRLHSARPLGKLEIPNSPRLGTSPSRERPNSYHAPPSPLMRTSAFSYTNVGPLTPLTPSHVPGAPSLQSSSAFEWFDYSMPESPAWQTPELEPEEGGESNRVKHFYRPYTPTSDHHGALRRSDAVSRLPPSPLGVGRFNSESVNPFFAP